SYILKCQINAKNVVTGCRCVKTYSQNASWITTCRLVFISERVSFGIETRFIVVWREHDKWVLSSKVHPHFNTRIFYQAAVEVVSQCYSANLQEGSIEIT